MRTKDFKIVKLLGKGTYGAVYKVVRKSDNEEYALKEVSLKALKKREREDAVNEVRVLASIKHRNILRYCEAFLEGSNLYIVTEYAKGGDLHGKIKRYTKKRKSLAEKTIWTYLLQLCSGLDTLHKINIMHRDLKPKNIFLTAHNQIRLGDLGCAKIMKAGMARTQIGTPYYMSPEIWEHKAYNAASDMWALGCIVFEMCSGRPPFLANDMQGLARKVRFNASPTIGSAYSRDLASLVKRLLSKDPRNRPTASAILKMDKIQAHASNLPETPANSRWNHKNMGANYEKHIRHGVLSTIKVPRVAPGNRGRNRGYGQRAAAGGHGLHGIKLPEAQYPVRALPMDDIQVGGNEPMSSPARGSKPVAVAARPSSAGAVRSAAAAAAAAAGGVKPLHSKHAMAKQQAAKLQAQQRAPTAASNAPGKQQQFNKPSRPSNNNGRNRAVAPGQRRQHRQVSHSRYGLNKENEVAKKAAAEAPAAIVPTKKPLYNAQGHLIKQSDAFLAAGGVKPTGNGARVAAPQVLNPYARNNAGRNYGGYGGYRHQGGPTRLW
jgi:serine/threonine protein kinase